MLVKTIGCALFGIDAISVTIEVNIDKGIQFFLVGLPDSAVKESHQRIEAALTNLGFSYPRKKITINMAPADIRKEGSAYDLPIAIGILAASGQVETEHLEQYIIMGELSPMRLASPDTRWLNKWHFSGNYFLKAKNTAKMMKMKEMR